MPPTTTQDRAMHSYGDSPRKLFGILTRKERWGLSWRGWLLVASAVLVGSYFAVFNIHALLAVTYRVDANALVVEGWMHPSAVQASVNEFKTGSYQRVFTTGGPVEGYGGYINDYYTSASVGADLLRKAGVSDAVLTMVPSHVIGRDRTYGAAVALRDWFRSHHVAVHSINVITEDCHARRTRLLYETALGKSVSVGIISVPNPDYDAKHWWRSSEGVREVIGESIAYIYAKFFFSPSTRGT